MPHSLEEMRHHQLLGVVLHRVALEVDLGSFWKEALATLAATAFEDPPTRFGGHAGTESVLLLASALGRLVSHFHGRKKVRFGRKAPSEDAGRGD